MILSMRKFLFIPGGQMKNPYWNTVEPSRHFPVHLDAVIHPPPGNRSVLGVKIFQFCNHIRIRLELHRIEAERTNQRSQHSEKFLPIFHPSHLLVKLGSKLVLFLSNVKWFLIISLSGVCNISASLLRVNRI